MKRIILVGPYPPTNLGLNEYNYHIANELSQQKDLEVIVLANVLDEPTITKVQDNLKIIRCWNYNSFMTFFQILAQILKFKPNLVWYNIIFTSFGDKVLQGSMGLLLPLATRISGYYSVVTLHHLMEFMDLSETKFKRIMGLMDFGGQLLTRLLLSSNMVYTTLSKYADVAQAKYKANNVRVIPHGYMVSTTGKSMINAKNILVFGKFGSYKKVEPAIEMFLELRKHQKDVKLIVAGGNHPSYSGYIESVAEQYSAYKDIIFTGYLAEKDLDRVFKNAALMYMPYTSNTGVSGVAHLACAYGLPILACKLPDIEEMKRESGMNLITIDDTDVDTVVPAMNLLFSDMSALRNIGKHNYALSEKHSMTNIVRQYLLEFEEAGTLTTEKREQVDIAA